MKMNKKASWVSWVLLLALVVSASVAIIIWARDFTEESTEHTIQYVSGRSDCRSILFSIDEGSSCSSLGLTNRGTLNIQKFMVRAVDNSQEITEPLLMNGQITVSIEQPLNTPGNSIAIIPIIESSGKLFGCSEKQVTYTC